MQDSKTIEKLDEVGVEFLENLREFGGNSVEFLEEQAPQVCHELIAMGRAEYTSYISLSLLAVIILWVTSARIGRKVEEHMDDEVDKMLSTVLSRVVGVFLCGLASIPLMTNFHDFVTVWFAPRVYIMEQIKGLIS